VPDATIIDGVSTDSINRDEPHPDDDVLPDEDDWDIDWDGDEEGAVEIHEPRETIDLMNDPSVWSSYS